MVSMIATESKYYDVVSLQWSWSEEWLWQGWWK